jgi:hypothetical protein
MQIKIGREVGRGVDSPFFGQETKYPQMLSRVRGREKVKILMLPNPPTAKEPLFSVERGIKESLPQNSHHKRHDLQRGRSLVSQTGKARPADCFVKRYFPCLHT